MSTLISFSARNGLSVSSPKVFDTRLIGIGTPDFASAAGEPSIVSAVIASAPQRHRSPPTASSGTFDTSSTFLPRWTTRSS